MTVIAADVVDDDVVDDDARCKAVRSTLVAEVENSTDEL
jgi:hypothetical protein